MTAHLQPLCLTQLHASTPELDGREPVEGSLNLQHEQRSLLTQLASQECLECYMPGTNGEET